MSDPIKVTIPSRGITLKFPGGSNPEQIKEAIDRDYPRDGRDVAYDIGQDPGYAEQMSLKEYEDLRKFKKENPANADQIWEGVRSLVDTIGSGLEKGGQAVANLDLMNAGEAVGRGVVTGVADLGDVINRITTWNSAPDTYEDFIAGKTDTPERRAEYDAKLKADFTDFKELQGYQAQRKSVVEKSPIPELTEAASIVADPTMLIPGAGEILGASKIAARGVGAVAKGVGKAAQVVTRPAVEVVERLSTVENPIIRNATKLASPVTTGVEVADAIARGAVTAGENLVNAPTRIGPLESLGRTANATNVDRALASVGRYGGDKLIQSGLAAATGGVEGAVIGGTLGGLADGKEGFYSGLGSGMVAGAAGGAAGNAYYQLSGQARTDAALADFNRFRSQLDEPTRAKIDTVAERDGLNAVVGLMDGAGVLRGQFKDADVNFLNAEEFKAKHKGADARGVQLIEADRPIIDINVDHKRSDYTFGHEIFHALEQVEQLSPKIERLKQEIVGGFIQNPDGTYTQAQAGFLSPAEIEARHAEYTKKLASSGADASAWVNDANIGQKASRVASELGAEYMARLISGSDPDAMLRGFDGLTRQIADHALLKMSNETLRGVAERLGTGTKPVESILFGGLKDAPPVVAAALRDVLRARKTMADRIELVDRSDRGLVIKPTDMTNPAAAELAVKAKIAVKDPNGAFRMRTDDEINKLEEVQAQAIKRVVESVPVADPSTPHLRVVDGNIVGGGISPEQAKAFLADPNLSNKVKESLGMIAGSMSNLNSGKGGNVLFIEYGPALRKIKSRLTGKFKNAYSSGIRLTQREIAPFSLSFNKGDVPYINAVDVSKLLSKAGDRAASDKLGPYGRDFDGFVTDVVSYFENVSNPSGVRTAELPGMTADKATFLNQFFGSQAKGGAEFVRSFRLDRITEARETGKRVAASELAWQRQKINWLPAENLGDSKVFNSPDSGYRIISKSNNKHSLYAPTGERIGIYDTQAKAEQNANKVAAALPRRNMASSKDVSYDDQGNIKFRNKEPKDWTPEDFAEYGKRFGVENLGPLSDVKEIAQGVAGNTARVPGGLDGKFTYYDLLWLKSHPVDVKSLPETTHGQLTAKLARTMEPAPGDKVSSFNAIVFGMLSPNAPLLPNEMGQARLRFGSMNEIKKFADLYPDNPTKENLVKLNQQLKQQLGFIAAGKGGLGIPITADLSNIVNAARLFSKNPDFFVKQPNESWANFVDKLTTQVPGFGTKTGSFGSVWQDPLNASISAMDRHMARIFGQELLGDPQLRQRFEGIIVDRFNKLLSDSKKVSSSFAKKISNASSDKTKTDLIKERNKELAKLPDPTATKAKSLDDVLGQAEVYGADRVREFVNEAVFAAMGSRKAKLITAKGEISANAPEHIRDVKWIETPADFQVMSDAYRSALEINERRANDLGIAVFPAQWTLWDRIRQRVEPHEAMFPGLEKLPALNDKQLAEAYAANKAAGYMSTPKAGKQWKRKDVGSPSQLAYFMPAETDYKYSHQPSAEGALLSDISQNGKFIPKDVYEHPEWYGDIKSKAGSESWSVIRKNKDNPDAKITIYRAAPKGSEINSGNWVTLSKSYADMHASGGGRDGTVLSKIVSVKDVRWDGNDFNEFGYFPSEPDFKFQPTNASVTFQPAEKLPNGQAWSTDNNYRVIQKDGGKFRVYAPTGAMIGVADTLDKSKKLIEKKSR